MTDEKRQHHRERIGQRIAALRRMAGLTQEELSLKAGLQRTHVAKLEAGRYAANVDTLQALAEALGMTVDIIDPRLADLAPLKTLT